MSANSKTISLTTLILLLIVVAVISYAATWQFVKVRTEDVLPDGIYVGSIKVGGLTIPEALVKVEAKAPMPDRDIELVWSGGSYRLDIDKFKPELDWPGSKWNWSMFFPTELFSKGSTTKET